MEKHLGRKLKKKEVVHHIDGDVTNNNIDNLLLLRSTSEHNLLHERNKWLNIASSSRHSEGLGVCVTASKACGNKPTKTSKSKL
jgi:hypothetical protein